MKLNREKYRIPFFIETGLKLFLCGILFFTMNKLEIFSNISMFQKVLISLIPIWVDFIIMFILLILLATLTIIYLPETYLKKFAEQEKSVNVEDKDNSFKENSNGN